jgi:Flp pilus assembly protein TadG
VVYAVHIVQIGADIARALAGLHPQSLCASSDSDTDTDTASDVTDSDSNSDGSSSDISDYSDSSCTFDDADAATANRHVRGSVAVVGGAIRDVIGKPLTGGQLTHGSSTPGTVTEGFGGVGRNVAEALARLRTGSNAQCK